LKILLIALIKQNMRKGVRFTKYNKEVKDYVTELRMKIFGLEELEELYKYSQIWLIHRRIGIENDLNK
jgi:hypothetical protein